MPQIGERKTWPNGNTGEWDGARWILVNKNQQQERHGASGGWEAPANSPEGLKRDSSALSLGDMAVGAGKGAANTGYGLLNVPGVTDGPRPDWMAPNNAGERAGYAGEQMGEYMIPIPGMKGAGLMKQMLGEGLRGYATSAVHGDKDPGIMGAVSAVGPAVSAAVGGAGKWLGNKAERVMRSVTVADNAKVPARTPYGPQSNPIDEVAGITANDYPALANEVDKKVTALDQQITGLYNKPVNAAKRIDVGTPLINALNDPAKAATLRNQPALAQRMQGVVQEWLDEAARRTGGTGQMSPAEVRQFKIDMRKTFNDNFKDVDVASVNELFQQMYKGVDDALDAAVPQGKGLNQRFSNAITMREQIEKRATQAANSRELVGGGPIGVMWHLGTAPFSGPFAKTRLASALPVVETALGYLSKFPGKGIFGLGMTQTQDNYKKKKP